MNTTTLQIPMSKKLRLQAATAAANQGFSSLQEAVRVFLTKLAADEVSIDITPAVRLSAKNDKRYAKMVDDIESGRVKPLKADSIEDLMQQLNS